MASLVEREGRWRALIRKGGHTRCATFDTRGAAKDWAQKIEREVDELRATGVMQPRGLTIADLIDRYIAEIYPLRQWGAARLPTSPASRPTSGTSRSARSTPRT